MRLIITTFLIFFNSATLLAKSYTLAELMDHSLLHSPLIKVQAAKIDAAKSDQRLANSYYFPVLSLRHSLVGSNNPVTSFAFKLNQENFKMADFAESSMNNPDFKFNNTTTLGIMLPIDVAGTIRTSKKMATQLVEVRTQERKWMIKEITKNIYGPYYAYLYLTQLREFIQSESTYLQRIVRAYESKDKSNVNRYLTYNQARIILSSLKESLAQMNQQCDLILARIQYLTGVEDANFALQVMKESEIEGSLDRELLASLKDWRSLKTLEREDLSVVENYWEISKRNIKKEKTRYLPEVFLFSDYNLHSEKYEQMGKDLSMGVMASWSFGLNKRESVAKARAEALVAEQEFNNHRLKIESEIKEQRGQLEALEERIEFMEKKHLLFLENKALLTLQYQRGSVELYNMLDNFVNYIENYSNLQGARTEYKMALMSHINNFRKD